MPKRGAAGSRQAQRGEGCSRDIASVFLHIQAAASVCVSLAWGHPQLFAGEMKDIPRHVCRNTSLWMVQSGQREQRTSTCFITALQPGRWSQTKSFIGNKG